MEEFPSSSQLAPWRVPPTGKQAPKLGNENDRTLAISRTLQRRLPRFEDAAGSEGLISWFQSENSQPSWHPKDINKRSWNSENIKIFECIVYFKTDLQYLLTFVWLNHLNLLIGDWNNRNLGTKWATSMRSRGIWLVLPKSMWRIYH